MYEDRQYQNKHIDGIIRLLSTYRKVCAQLPTGGGKTVEFAKIAHRYHQKTGKSVIILVHREELLQQTKKTIEAMFGMTVSTITAGTKWVRFCPVYIGMVESVHRRAEMLPEVGLVIIDEAHNAAFNKLHSVFTEEYIIGFTATPKSSSKKEPMNKYYHEIAVGPQIKELILLGNLCQNITRSPKDVVDRTKLAMAVTGDFDIGGMASEFSRTRYIMSTVMAYGKFGKGKKAIVYNVNVKHSEEVTECFNFCGFPCKHVDGDTPAIQRTEIFKWFKETENAVLCNVGVATMGFDEPTVEIIIVNRATASMPLWLQMCGRGSRRIDEFFITQHQHEYPYPLKLKGIFTIIDMGGNCVTHGDWSDERDWDYIFKNPEKSGDGIAPVKECPLCGGFVHAATVKCTLPNEKAEECGHIFNRKKYEEQELIKDYIVVTENIDVDLLIKENENKRNYFVFFEMGRKIVDGVSKIGKQVTNEQKEAIFKEYFNLVIQWHKKVFPDKILREQYLKDFARQYFETTFRTRFKHNQLEHA